MDDPLTESQARDILEAWVRTTFLRRRDLARRLEISSFTAPGAHRVTFQSYTEQRTTGWTHVPYRSGPVDGPENGPIPDPWSIAVTMPPLFTDSLQQFEMPHSATVRICGVCSGRGEVRCTHCGGDGRLSCSSCGGSGHVTRTRTNTTTDAQGQSHTTTETYTESCMHCSGSGRVTCHICHGRGEVTCPTCDGATRLRHFLRLDVTWTNHVTVDVLEGTELPNDLLLEAEGRVALLEEEPRIEPTPGAGAGAEGGPFRGGPMRLDKDVDAMANRLILGHRFATEVKLHKQRLTIHRVPVYRAEYRWGKESRQFFVYGDKRVHAERYPLSHIRLGAISGGVAAVIISGVVAIQAAPHRNASQASAASETGPSIDIPVPTSPQTIPVQLADAAVDRIDIPGTMDGSAGHSPSLQGATGVGTDPSPDAGPRAFTVDEGNIAPDALTAAIRGGSSRMRLCVDAAQARNPHASGRVMIRFTIGPRGRVLDSAVHESTVSDRELGQCLATAVRSLQFPSIRGRSVVVTYPFLISSID